MTLVFTEEELKWIDKVPFNWKVKEGCPDSIRSHVERKLKLVNEPQVPPSLKKEAEKE